jgi:general secretion pathway protein B
MSYILDALRKSEQQRQAIEPGEITDRLRIAPPQSKNESKNWLKTLLLLNLLLVLSLIWFFIYKPNLETSHNSAINLKPVPNKPEPQLAQLPESLNKGITQQQTHEESTLPAISKIVESKKIAGAQPFQLTTNQKQTPEKKISSIKKKIPHQESTDQEISKRRTPETYDEQPVLTYQNPVNVREVPFQERNRLPNLNINVFSYAQKPEDRFVIIDMVKVKPGQFIKDSVRLKEIREDSIVVEDGAKTYKIERP